MVKQILLFFLILVSVASATKTRGQIKAEAKDLLAKAGSDTTWYPDSIWNRAVQEATELLANQADGVVKRDTIITLTDQSIYALNSDFLKAKSLHRFSTMTVLSKINSEDGGQIAVTVADTGFTSFQYWINGQFLTLQPRPNRDDDSVLLWYFAIAKVLIHNDTLTNVLPIYDPVFKFFAASLAIVRESHYRASYFEAWGEKVLNNIRANHGLPPVDILLEPEVIKQ